MTATDKYFDLMKKISNDVHLFINKEINVHIQSDRYSSKLSEALLLLPNARNGKNILRSTLTEAIYRILGGDKTITAFNSLSEINNINAYLDNWILDNKKQIWIGGETRQKISEITIASAIFRELLEDIILKSDIEEHKKTRILGVFSKAIIYSYQGQQLDLEMSIETINDYKNDEIYLNKYVNKSLLQSGYLYGVSAEIGAILAGANKELIDLSRMLGEIIGTGLHISNDLGDFAILKECEGDFKSYQDQMADLKNGRLTLPIYYVLKHGDKQSQKNFLSMVSNDNVNLKNKREVIQSLKVSGSYDYCKKLIRKYYNQSKLIIDKFPNNEHKEILSYFPVVIRSNKYLSDLKNY